MLNLVTCKNLWNQLQLAPNLDLKLKLTKYNSTKNKGNKCFLLKQF